MRRPEQLKTFSSNSNGDLDLSPIMLKHKLIQDVAIPKLCMKLYQNQSINESIGLLTTYFYEEPLTLAPRELKLKFDQDIFHTKHLFEVTAKSVH